MIRVVRMVAFWRKISEDPYQSRRWMEIGHDDLAPLGEPEIISDTVEKDREILIPFAARCAKRGQDELLINPLKQLSYKECRHSSAGRAADL